VLAHMPPQFLLCSLSSYELVHTDGVGLLPEISSVLPCVEHLHHGKHGTHSWTWALCLLILVLHQSIVVSLYPSCNWWIHLRKGPSGTGCELITMLLTDLAQNLKSHLLGTFPRALPLGLSPPFLHCGACARAGIVICTSYHSCPSTYSCVQK
jgi:hypothetical protein